MFLQVQDLRSVVNVVKLLQKSSLGDMWLMQENISHEMLLYGVDRLKNPAEKQGYIALHGMQICSVTF